MDKAGTLTGSRGWPLPGSAPADGLCPAQWRPPPWRPLLHGEQADRARRAATRLAATLPPPATGSLAGGSAGVAVCHAVLAHVCGDQQAAARASGCLDHAAAWLAAQHLGASLYRGFTGVAWAAGFVDRMLGEQTASRSEAVDAALLSLLRRTHGDEVPYDLINGLTGYGTYAVANWPCPAAARQLAAVVEQFAARARRESAGVYWRTPPSLLAAPQRQRYPGGGVDLGVAHGLAGVLPVLARAQALGVARELAGDLLSGAVSWLVAHLADTRRGPTVPGFLAAGDQPRPTRSAWCYGDPGVAVVLLLAARDAGREDWADMATGLALRAAARSPEETGVADAGLCHGTAGLAHLFNRLHQLTGEPELAAAARCWTLRTLDLCAAAEGGAAAPWQGPGLLEGAAGVALSLLASATGTEPAWDQLLLVATAGPAGCHG